MTVTDDLDRLARRELADPHAILGAHPAADGVVVRALRPGASAVRVRVAGETVAALEPVHAVGIFEGLVAGASLPLRYELEASYPAAPTWTTSDAYSFPPTLGDMDVYLAGEGRHEELYSRLGAHPRELEGVAGTAFAVWAPAARAVSVVGEFNFWDGRMNPMRCLGSSGIWEVFLPGVGPGAHYKYEILTQSGEIRSKADPYAFETEVPPKTASVVHLPRHEWADGEWMRRRAESSAPLDEPMSIYEVHLGSWRLNPLEGNRPLSYLELADELSDYVTDMGFTHVELLPVMAHPFTGSWGYQVSGYFAPTPRYGSPDELRAFVDRLHRNGIGVILDWVPAHFPRDDWALARFDGTALYEHADPRRGEHPDWGTLVFNYGRNEVRNFLVANALFWLREYHADGIRVDAVASMLYLDYSREAGQWVPNEFGGREDLEAVAFLKEYNEVVHAREGGIVSAAEESTAWPGVSRPVYLGGLGFGFKWNMGWMHDTLGYFEQDPVYRRWHHHELTFSMVYAFTENFILPLSHDEVVHGKGSLYQKMPGDRWQKLANLRALYAFMWAHPGKKLLFMGGEFAQEGEWAHERSLDWHLLENRDHAGVQALVRDLNHAYREEPALWSRDFDSEGFAWLEPNDAEHNVLSFARFSPERERALVFAANLSPVPRQRPARGRPMRCPWRGALARARQLGRGGLRRGEHRQPRRRRSRGGAVARPALLRPDHPAPARGAVARAGGVGRGRRPAGATASSGWRAAPACARSPGSARPGRERICGGVERVNGIGGVFFRARDPGALSGWYAEHLGITPPPPSYEDPDWWQEEGPTVFAPFEESSQHLGRPEQQWSVNFRVRDLDAMVSQLRRAGIEVEVDPETYPNGRFASLADPEGNPVQLWEPRPRTPRRHEEE